MVKVEDLLPIGSIVVLKEGEQPLMVCGVMQQNSADKIFSKAKDYDYISVVYPNGYMGKEHLYLFNHEDINKIIFRGFEDKSRQDFLRELKGFVNEREAN